MASRPGMSGTLHVYFLLLLLLNFSASCPVPCICKWKGGKQTVECRNQNLNALPDDIDAETQVLDISGNKLRVLPRDTFTRIGLLNLQRVHVRNSHLSQIDPGAFNELINLIEIDLADNLLTAVPKDAFRATPFLRELNLAGNPLVHIKNGDFDHVPQLIKLELSGCQLVRIEDAAFAPLSLLESLKINQNRLSGLSNYTVKSLAQLHGIELDGNPWDCDCRLQQLKVWIEARNIPHPISPLCHTPTRLRGRRFGDLNITDFACTPHILNSVRRVRVYEEESATLECLVDSLPTTIRWYLGGRPIANNTVISSNRKFLIYEEGRRSLLVLTNPLEMDSGDFFCVVENPAGLIEANFTLEILPKPPFPTLSSTHIAMMTVSILGILLFILSALLFVVWRKRSRGLKPPEILAASTPVKPPRLSYEINPGSLVGNGYKGKGDDNPDLILETNNGPFQDPGGEESSNSELNWEQVSYRNMGYATEYPSDYGLPIIHEHSAFSEPGSLYNGGPSAVWKKSKIGARITAPSSRDSPDEGYQEGYCGTDV